MKICTICKRELEKSNFHKRAASKDGLMHKCKQCCTSYSTSRYSLKREELINVSKEYNTKNKDKVRARKKEYREANKEVLSQKRREYYESNKERELANRAAYQKAFPEKCNAVTAKRKAIQLKATPSWTDLKKVEEFYKQAQEQSELNKEPYQVHHVIPLVSSKVCGLHCESNLAVITATENHQIGNRHWPDMW